MGVATKGRGNSRVWPAGTPPVFGGLCHLGRSFTGARIKENLMEFTWLVIPFQAGLGIALGHQFCEIFTFQVSSWNLMKIILEILVGTVLHFMLL